MIGTSVQSMGFQQGQENHVETATLPAPNAGIDTRAQLGTMESKNCIYAYNMVPAEYGMLQRPGYREWQIDVDEGGSFGVHSIVVFDGTVTTPSDNRLFAVNNEGIWDVTVEGAAPILKASFTFDTTINAGYGVFAHYTDQAGVTSLYYADNLNGLWVYEDATDLWAAASEITGPDLTKVAFIVVHKQRIWLIEQDSDIGWYLPIASKTGIAKEFFFGSKFSHGGKLKALVNWSVDGGAGVDDYLVAIASSGDILPYQGADPEAIEGGSGVTTVGWAVRGTYFIGKIPEGRRFFSEYSGEMYILSSFGLIAMSDLLRGVDASDASAKSLTYPIASILRSQFKKSGDIDGWEPMFIPTLGTLVINSPPNPETGIELQYVMNLAIEGWGIWRGVPMICLAEWDTKMYFGTADSKIMVMDVTRDNGLLDTDDPLSIGLPIEFSMLTAYSAGGSEGMFKTAQYVRPDFLTEIPLTFSTKVFYNYDIGEVPFPVSFVDSGEVGQWDIGEWDNVIWGGGLPKNQNRLQGQTGLGRTMAIALRGESIDFARLISFDVAWTKGGFV